MKSFIECVVLHRTRAHLQQGSRPSKKLNNLKDVKRYLNAATIARGGLLVVKRDEPLVPTRKCIIVPRQVLDGLLTALHIQLNHPYSNQLEAVCIRLPVRLIFGQSHRPCNSGLFRLRRLQTPKARVEQSSSPHLLP